MPTHTPKSESVTEQGESDGWVPPLGFAREMDPGGHTRMIVSVPHTAVLDVHTALLAAMAEPIGFLYRQVVDRQKPRPEGSPPRDFVALELDKGTVQGALHRFTGLIHHDARCELWLRGAMGEQLVLDADGVLYAYPDDPTWEEVLLGQGLAPELDGTIVDRDYAKHWFHAEHDALEAEMIRQMRLVEVPPRG